MNRAELARFQRLAKPQANGCWMWTGQRTNKGYGLFQPGPGQSRQPAYRWAYENFVGPIPDGFQIDHACHTRDVACPGGPECHHRACVNPEHLEPVTASENTIRQRHANRLKSHCPKGHEYAGDNLIVDKSGRRRCRQCDRERKSSRRNILEG